MTKARAKQTKTEKVMSDEEAAKLPPANEAELRAAEEAKARRDQRPAPIPLKVSANGEGKLNLTQTVGEGAKAKMRLMDICGTTDAHWCNHVISCMAVVKKTFGSPDEAVQAGFAFMNGLTPKNEVEAALGAHMFTTHALMMRMALRAEEQTSVETINALYGQYNKLARTFTAQAEAMAKLRNGGKQTVEVKYVDARNSQNIIAENVTTGGGGTDGNPVQPHAQALAYQPGTYCAEMPSEVQKVGLPMQGTSDQGQI